MRRRWRTPSIRPITGRRAFESLLEQCRPMSKEERIADDVQGLRMCAADG